MKVSFQSLRRGWLEIGRHTQTNPHARHTLTNFRFRLFPRIGATNPYLRRPLIARVQRGYACISRSKIWQLVEKHYREVAPASQEKYAQFREMVGGFWKSMRANRQSCGIQEGNIAMRANR